MRLQNLQPVVSQFMMDRGSEQVARLKSLLHLNPFAVQTGCRDHFTMDQSDAQRFGAHTPIN